LGVAVSASAQTAIPRVSTGAPAVAPRHACRDTHGHYPASEKGKLAVDGSLLDHQVLFGDGYVASSAWRLGDCGFCYGPEFRRMIPLSGLRCPRHGRQPIPPGADPFPRDEREQQIGEAREWAPIASKWGIPSRYRSARLEDATPTPAIRAVRRFLLLDEHDDEEDLCGCLILAGPTGVGKTFAAIAGFRHEAVRHSGQSNVYQSFPSLIRRLIGGAGSHEEDDDEPSVFDQCAEADLLVCDDAGGTHLKEGGLAEALFEELIVIREAEEKCTVLTTNLTRPRFEDLFGDRIADRLAGPWGLWVDLPGRSLRRAPLKATTS
jgi:hypothetical protein